jgi:hypothetical protein
MIYGVVFQVLEWVWSIVNWFQLIKFEKFMDLKVYKYLSELRSSVGTSINKVPWNNEKYPHRFLNVLPKWLTKILW